MFRGISTFLVKATVACAILLKISGLNHLKQLLQDFLKLISLSSLIIHIDLSVSVNGINFISFVFFIFT